MARADKNAAHNEQERLVTKWIRSGLLNYESFFLFLPDAVVFFPACDPSHTERFLGCGFVDESNRVGRRAVVDIEIEIWRTDLETSTCARESLMGKYFKK